MAYDDYSDEAELSPLEMAQQMTGDALALVPGTARTVGGAAIATRVGLHLAHQSVSLGRSAAHGQIKYNGIPAGLGIRTLLGKSLGRGAGIRGFGAGAMLGGVLGGWQGSLVGSAIGVGASILPRMIGRHFEHEVTSTGLKGMFEAFGKQGPNWLNTAINGNTLSKASKPASRTAEMLRTGQRIASNGGIQTGAGVFDRSGNAIEGVGFNANTLEKRSDLFASRALKTNRISGNFVRDVSSFVAAGHGSASTAIDAMIADVSAARGAPNMFRDIGDLFTGGSAGKVKRVLQAQTKAGAISAEASAAGFSALNVNTRGAKLAAGGRLLSRVGGVGGAAALVGLGAIGVAAGVSQLYRGSQVLRANLRDMNTSLRLTEFGGRGSFTNDTVNTERDRAISAMQFLRSGRDFIGMEARLLAEGFNG